MANITVEETINGLVSEASAALSTARTPEEAYKIFMASAGRGMMQVMANALADATGNTVTATAENTAISGWQNYVTGCTVAIDFGSPSFGNSWLAGAPNNKDIPSTKLQTSVSPGAIPAILGGSITIGGSWSF